MSISHSETGKIEWKSFVFDEKWGEFVLDSASLELLEASDEKVGQTLVKIFHWLQSQGLENAWGKGVSIRTDADFHMQWGLGSSSTLVSLISQWTGANAYDLQFSVFGGSGYDIACATAEGPVTYQLVEGEPVVHPVDFHPPFASHIHFIYTGRKKDSRLAMAEFKAAQPEQLSGQIAAIDSITEHMVSTASIEEFEALIRAHENIIAETLKTDRIRDLLGFSDYPGEIKSLGGWGGDFMMATGETAMVKDYFTAKGLSPVFTFDELTKHRNVHA